MKLYGRNTIIIMSCLVFLLCSVATSIALPGPTDDLKPTLDTLVEHLQDPSLKGDAKKDERRKIIMTTVKKGFNFREMSRRVLGKTWKKISDTDKVKFTQLMTDLLENAYIGKLENYSGQKIGFTDEKIKGKRAQVSTSVENGGVQIPIHYILSFNGQKWMVYDINIEGVSLIRNYMQQFKSILRRDKFEGLVKILEEKISSF